MYYINTKTLEYPLTNVDIKAKHPNISFSDSPHINLDPYKLVNQTISPEYDSKTQYIKEIAPKVENGDWIQQWEIFELSQEILQKNKEYLEKATRAERNNLLQNTDWTQIQDSPVNSEAWKNYRQQLRDITTQANFPYEVIWPTPPT
jgi:uncharacterized LabA/DUF88 family protein